MTFASYVAFGHLLVPRRSTTAWPQLMMLSRNTLLLLELLGVLALLWQTGTGMAIRHGGPRFRADFSYNDSDIHGPLHWGDLCQDIGRQSPINIQLVESMYDSRIRGLTFSNYNSKASTLSLVETNNGHTAIIDVDGTPSPTLSEGGLRCPYYLRQFHFHWGQNETYGSEHTFNDRGFPLEVHFVHAATRDDVPENEQLAVTAVMFRLSEKRNPALDPIVNNLDNILHAGDAVPLQDVVLASLLPDRYDRFFRYYGSLTTPPCSEQVIWTVFYDTVPISREQLAKFRQLLDSHGQTLDLNNRPIQDAGGRRISASFLANPAMFELIPFIG